MYLPETDIPGYHLLFHRTDIFLQAQAIFEPYPDSTLYSYSYKICAVFPNFHCWLQKASHVSKYLTPNCGFALNIGQLDLLTYSPPLCLNLFRLIFSTPVLGRCIQESQWNLIRRHPDDSYSSSIGYLDSQKT
jgi:hypothetical protein